jgi:hypothetical protein
MYTQARFRRMWAVLLLFPLGLMVAGCGRSSEATVTGKVTYKGQPLKGGSVSLISEAGGVVRSTIEEDGSYKITKAPVGPAKVTVDTKALRPVNQKAVKGPYANANAPQEVLPKSAKGGDASRYVAIPARYADPEKSGLTVEVKSGKNEQNIELE